MSADLYCEHFGFSERPFSLSPDPDFLFWTRAHMRAFSILEYGITTRAPLTVVTGEVGTGKTTLIQQILRQIDRDLRVGLISNARGNRDDLLRWVLNALDVKHPADADYVSMFQTFQDFVIDAYSEGQRVVLIIDEAQNLGVDTLEELRMLTNINSGKDELLQLILVGQPELRQMIARPDLRQFAQRVSATYHIEPLDLKTTRQYVAHRLQAVGGTGREISPSAVTLIASHSQGIPRVINKICDLALVYAASAERKLVSLAIVKELIDDGVIIQTFTSPLFLTNRVNVSQKAAE
ncbi:AAA family ATPase [Octadecabacter sp. 1_MG-2023]|uniref:ExeA family protein n=1 Tax=unclassified Octadecabacter TaxID=196158 RepID=UPI001C08AD93|nr:MULTISPECIES: AAA family ATPase [unclassified Octadecabacter]MBU2993992.1 AAA family ATPase [Octadecabacter sp. B2R22]MDO6736065.1 AAA family ATPase [Octadecabacter sp. 1_MG-2023]